MELCDGMNLSARSIVIIGSLDDHHVAAVKHRLKLQGHKPTILDVQHFPEKKLISMGESLDAIFFGDEQMIPACVYIRNMGLNPIDNRKKDSSSHRFTSVTYRERSEFIVSLAHRWEEVGVPIYNPPSTRHRVTKPFQLALLAKAGLPVPETLWSNDPEKVRQFSADRHTAYKPVVGGAATQELLPKDLTNQRLSRLASAPVTFQELLPGDDIRVYVLDEKIIASYRIVTQALDFRQNEETVETIELSKKVQSQCLDAAKTIGLKFTGMDLKGDSNGTLRFLELNPSPMFLGFDKLAGTNILEQFSDTLSNHTEPSN